MALACAGLELMGLTFQQATTVQVERAGGSVAGMRHAQLDADLLDGGPALGAWVFLGLVAQFLEQALHDGV
jgi:hypothetical protein